MLEERMQMIQSSCVCGEDITNFREDKFLEIANSMGNSVSLYLCIQLGNGQNG